LNDLAASILSSTPNDMPKYYTTKLKTLVYTCLSKNPEDRPNIDEALSQIPQITKTAYESEFRFTEVKERCGAISSRESPTKKVTDLPLEVIPIPIYKKTVKMDTGKLTRPVTAYKNTFNVKSQNIRPNTGKKSRRINLKFSMNLDNFRHKSNFSHKNKINGLPKEYFKPKKDQVQITNHQKLELIVLKR
jgi:serine/threonine protein kinase